MKLLQKQIATSTTNLFEESGIAQQFLRECIDDIITDVSRQITHPEDSYREVVQNAIDSGTPRIDIYTEDVALDEEFSNLTIHFEDYGCGMTHEVRDGFFKNLFKSTKEKDLKKIGVWGIGISSVFLLNLSEMHVHSTAHNPKTGMDESWTYHIMGIDGSPSHNIDEHAQTRKGTKVSLTRKVKTVDLKEHRQTLVGRVRHYCGMSRTPIYHEGKFLNTSFDLDTPLKYTYTRDDLEFVIGIPIKSDGGTGTISIFNNRLLLERKDGPMVTGQVETTQMTNPFGDIESPKEKHDKWKELSVLVCSPYFKHTWQRDSVVKDRRYEKIMAEVQKSINGLYVKALELLEHHLEHSVPCPETVVYTFKIDVYGRSFPYWVRDERSAAMLRHAVELERAEKDRLGADYIERFADGLEAVEERFALWDAQVKEHRRQWAEYNKTQASTDLEMQVAWKFVTKFIEEKAQSVQGRRKGSNPLSRTWKYFRNPRTVAMHLASQLPRATADYKILPSETHGAVSIVEMLESISRDGCVFRNPVRGSGYTKLLMDEGKMEIISEQSGYKHGMFMEMLGKHLSRENDHRRYINRVWHRTDDVYSLPMTDLEYEVGERETEFLERVRKRLPARLRSRMSGMGYTDGSNKFSDDGKPVYYREDSGLITPGEERPGFFRKIRSAMSQEFLGHSKPHRVALNLSNGWVQKMMSLATFGDEVSQEFALRSTSNFITNHYPGYFPIFGGPPRW